ncbi:neurofilament heavy polypeptide-like [Drosophila madeirensis]|uniref:Neurofilament heavy polypeptide-like n=1 Tax=Drosophila madeirensis TaxID=30013 RepID=A0AAU9G988_DROMD
MIGGRVGRLLLPQLQLSRWKRFRLEPRSHFLQPQQTFSQESDKSCVGGKSPKKERKPSKQASNTRLDRRRRHLQEMQKKKAAKEKTPKPPNHCAKAKEQASKENSCGKSEPKASKDSSCDKGKEKDPCAVYKKFLTDAKAKKPNNAQASGCESAVAEEQPQPKSQITKSTPPPPQSCEVRQPVDWNAMESLLNCMISGVKVACVTHEQRKMFDKLVAARERRLDDEEAAQNIKCAEDAVKEPPRC